MLPIAETPHPPHLIQPAKLLAGTLSEDPVNQIIGSFEKIIAGMNINVPAQITDMIQGSLKQSITAYENAAESMKSCGEALNTMIGKQQALTREIGERVLHNATTNIEASVDVAKKLAASRSFQEAMKIQTEFAQAQSKRFADQAEGMLSLAMKASSEAVASWPPAFPTKTRA
jgi:hypothetical protein